MPVLACRLADVRVGDAHPFEALGLGDHLLDPGDVAPFHPGAIGEGQPRVLADDPTLLVDDLDPATHEQRPVRARPNRRLGRQ